MGHRPKLGGLGSSSFQFLAHYWIHTQTEIASIVSSFPALNLCITAQHSTVPRWKCHFHLGEAPLPLAGTAFHLLALPGQCVSFFSYSTLRYLHTKTVTHRGNISFYCPVLVLCDNQLSLWQKRMGDCRKHPTVEQHSCSRNTFGRQLLPLGTQCKHRYSTIQYCTTTYSILMWCKKPDGQLSLCIETGPPGEEGRRGMLLPLCHFVPASLGTVSVRCCCDSVTVSLQAAQAPNSL